MSLSDPQHTSYEFADKTYLLDRKALSVVNRYANTIVEYGTVPPL